jgi:hypothetical protein
MAKISEDKIAPSVQVEIIMEMIWALAERLDHNAEWVSPETELEVAKIQQQLEYALTIHP